MRHPFARPLLLASLAIAASSVAACSGSEQPAAPSTCATITASVLPVQPRGAFPPVDLFAHDGTIAYVLGADLYVARDGGAVRLFTASDTEAIDGVWPAADHVDVAVVEERKQARLVRV